MVSLHPDCESLHHQSYTRVGWTLIVILGTIASNIPQQYRIARRRSAEGISSYFLLTGVISATCALANIVGLSVDNFQCCNLKAISKGECTSATLSVVLIGVQWTVMFLIMLLWSAFLPVTEWEYPDNPHATVSDVIWTNSACFLHFAFTFGIFGILYKAAYLRLTAYSNAQGIISAIVAALQYAPQIWTTWRLKHIGSISVPWLIVQTPGGLVAMSALVGAPGTNWTTWLASIGTFLGQFVLLIISCCWTWRDWKAERKREKDAGIVREGWTWRNWPRKLFKWIFK